MSIVQLSRFFVCVVLFKRQLLYFIKSFCLCQELFYFSLSLFLSFPLPSHATAYLGYHFQNSLSTTFLIYFSIISLIFKSSSFLPIKNVPPPRLLSSSVPLLFSLLFLSDECYLITAVFNCQCFLYISCNSEYSEKLASAFPNTNSYCKLACSKLIGLLQMRNIISLIFESVIMSDWNTTVPEDGSIPWVCVAAGNDIIMPGNPDDDKNIRDAYKEGKLTEKEIRLCANRILKLIRRLS